ncbi:hypothetical protein D7044_15295 [Micromonospora musae]|uniref:Uncharacterized protein n=2 Tax=Micromonospora musae TaxID=1894970 RepID=A0A3A9Y4T3_9ACTN|nr:hypothetical protein D7044_15295 [Micromonospora musae]
MAGVRAGIARSHRRRRYASAGLAAFTLLAVSGTAVLVARPEQPASRPADNLAANAQTGPVPPQECRLSLGWLPEGLVEPSRICGPTAQSVLYPMYDGPYLSVSIDQSGWQGPRNTRGWEPVTVNGEAGYLVTRATRTFVKFPLPSGRWVSVEYGVGMPGARATAGLEATARRIAEHISETPTESLNAPFAPTYLPPGQRLANLRRDGDGASVTYQDGSGRIIGATSTSTTEDGVIGEFLEFDDGAGYRISWTSNPPGDYLPLKQGERIADIQGRPAHRFNEDGIVVVDGFHGGQLTVSTRYPVSLHRKLPKPANPTPELVRIAEGVRWLG